MFTGYFDESDTKGAAVVAGCIGHAKQWELFEGKWARLLREYDIQDGFHMSDFASRSYVSNQYSLWEETKCREFLDRLIRIIGSHTTISVGIALDRRVYDAFVCTPGRKAVFESEYVTASWLCLTLIDNWAEKRRDLQQINFVFDRGNGHRHAFQKSYDYAYRGKEYFSTLTFEDDQLVLPLQAADFVAYEISKGWTSHSIDKRTPRKTFDLARQVLNHCWRVVDSPGMLQALARQEGIA
jgi:hypothetical protein